MTRKKTIALISRADARGGGASRVADDIATLLGQDAEWKPRRYIGEFIAPASRNTHKPIESRAKGVPRLIRTGLKRIGYVDHLPVELPFLNSGIVAADVIHAHDITTVMSPATLQMLARVRALVGRRVIWTLHDMSPITGGCIYPIGCGGWRDGCGSCPMLDQWPFASKMDRTAAMQRKRLQVLRQGTIELVSPSRWLANHVEVAVPGAQVRVIPNGVDTTIFAPKSAELPASEDYAVPRMLFIANHIRDMRKGGTYISNISRHVNAIGRDLELVVVGSGNEGALVRQGHLTIRYTGRFDDKAGLAQAYRSTDALLLPTHADNFPLVMTEALACALPVFAFDTGGIAEAIDDTCGSVRPAGHIDNLVDDFLAARDAGALPRLAQAARKRAQERYSMEAFAQAHRDLYASSIRDIL